ncbi:hypothetical protein GCM10009786_27570 [Leucobacter alluvii]|uniref:CAAX prenyl protease 2/Lysostaphin resistance protein A-like domain-containing protein n=1 Tax=Leucobacter alluvii TaxID=340321 RepID=A0ABN3B8W2_9MICO
MSASVRVPRTFWVGLIAVVIYLLFAAGLGNLMDVIIPTSDPTAELAASHFIPLTIAIVLALMFVRWSGWSAEVWSSRSTLRDTPRRWWLVAIPVLMLLLPLSQLPGAPWGERGVGGIFIVLAATLMVGFGEELVIRGILFASIRANHGELVTLLGTSLIFGAAHIAGSLIAGVDPLSIVFQVGALAMNGSLYYWVRRVSGGLWLGILIHALTDFSLYISSGDGSASEALQSSNTFAPVDIFPGVVQWLLIILSIAGVVSAALEDRRTRRARVSGASGQ